MRSRVTEEASRRSRSMARGGFASASRTAMPMRSRSLIITEEQAMVPIHPGRILRRELQARRLSANALARALRVPSGRIVDILNGKRSVTAETALRLGRYFSNAPQFWINLQAQYDLAVAMREVGRLVE